MARTPEVKVKVGADTTALDRGLASAQQRLSTFAKVSIAGAATAVVGLAGGMAALTKASLDNIDALTKQARSLGLSTSAFQRMTMVAKEAGIEAGRLSSMLGIMQRNLDGLAEGTKSQVEAFQRLGLSLSDLQGLSPDQQFERIAAALDKISDPTQKTALAMEVLGKSGRDAINMLSGYSEKAREAAVFQERFGIAVSQSVAENVERANDSVGRLKSVMEGLGNTLAGAVAPAIEATANGIIQFIGNVAGFRVELEQFFGSLENAKASLGEDLFLKVLGRPDLIREHAHNLDAIVIEFDDLEDVAAKAAAELRTFAMQLDSIGAIAEADVVGQLMSRIYEIDGAFKAGQISAEEFQKKMMDVILRAQGVVSELENIDGVSFSRVFSNIAGLTARLAEAGRAAAQARANIEAALFEQSPAGQAMAKYADRGTTSDTPTIHGAPPPVAPPVAGKSRGGEGGGGGKAIQDLFEERLKALEDGLMTEAEVISVWYEDQLSVLEEALNRKQITEERYHDLRERLEREHQERLAGIREMGNQWGVESALRGGAEILGALGSTNRQALKMQKVFSAGAAFIDVYRGAAAELKKGTLGFAGAAAVIAKGIGFVAAINSVNESGTGRGGGSGPGASAGASGGANLPTQTVRWDFGGQQAPMGAREMVDMLNQAGAMGYRLNVEMVGAR